MKWKSPLAGLPLLLVAACGAGKTMTDADFEAGVVANTFQLLKSRVRALHQAALDLQSAAPASPDRGWDGAMDAAALISMKNSWISMRTAWESSEGVVTQLFPDLDQAMDSRYEDLLSAVVEGGSTTGDADPFDGSGIIGMHAIERILYAPDTPQAVVSYEAGIGGASPAVWPATAEEAAAFKSGLCQRLVDDSQALVTGWQPERIKLSDAFKGLQGLMQAQEEKVNLAAEHQEESRYSQRTMSDLRHNLSGTTEIYELFTDWLSTKPNGLAINAEVEQALDMLGQIYGGVDGVSIPDPPADWSSKMVSPENQQTPFGMLYRSVLQAVEPTRPGSVVDAMNHAAKTLGLSQLDAG
jgi:iron uptake system component EfeO